jgi:hypothetical protein
MKIGDIVTCVNIGDMYDNGLTLGRKYKLIDHFGNNEKISYILNDEGRKFGYYKWRFKKVTNINNNISIL